MEVSTTAASGINLPIITDAPGVAPKPPHMPMPPMAILFDDYRAAGLLLGLVFVVGYLRQLFSQFLPCLATSFITN